MKVVKLFVLVFSALLLVGCQNGIKPITGEEFKTHAESLKHEVLDYTDRFDYAKKAYVISKSGVYVLFVEGNSTYTMKSIFADECSNVYSQAGSDYEDEVHTNKEWASLKVTNKNNYYYVAWSGNTYIYASAPITKKYKIEDLIEEINY